MRYALLLIVFVVLAILVVFFESASVCFNNACYSIEHTNNDIKLLSAAAKKGNAQAQQKLAYRYATGEGVIMNYDKAVELWRKSAESGNATSEYVLGDMYAGGIRISRDYVLAYMWFDIALNRGVTRAAGSRYF